jgi:orotidine-5'-phosphate decarboxylase
MPDTALSKKDFERYQRRLGEQSSDTSEGMQRVILAFPGRTSERSVLPLSLYKPADDRDAQLAQLVSSRVLAFSRVGADEVGRRDARDWVRAYQHEDHWIPMFLREPCAARPEVFERVVHNRLAEYEMVVIPGDLGPEMLRLAIKVDAQWKERRGPRPNVFVEPLPPWVDDRLHIHGMDLKLGPEYVLARALPAIEAGIRGVLCAPEDLPALRERCPIYPATDHVRLLVDGCCLDRANRPLKGYTRGGMTYEAAAAAGADAILVGQDLWTHPDPFEAFLEIAAQIGRGARQFRESRPR